MRLLYNKLHVHRLWSGAHIHQTCLLHQTLIQLRSSHHKTPTVIVRIIVHVSTLKTTCCRLALLLNLLKSLYLLNRRLRIITKVLSNSTNGFFSGRHHVNCKHVTLLLTITIQSFFKQQTHI